MIFKVGIGNTFQNLNIESGYTSAKQRFDEILVSKLGIRPAEVTATMTQSETSASDVLQTKSKDIDTNTIVRKTSTISASQIDNAFKGTPLEGLGKDFVSAANQYGVDARFLAALAAHESGYGKSKIATEKNNLFGFRAYDSSPFLSAKSYATKSDSINNVAKYLSKEYLTENGKYFNGYSIGDIGKRYATDPNWASKVVAHMKKLG